LATLATRAKAKFTRSHALAWCRYTTDAEFSVEAGYPEAGKITSASSNKWWLNGWALVCGMECSGFKSRDKLDFSRIFSKISVHNGIQYNIRLLCRGVKPFPLTFRNGHTDNLNHHNNLYPL
jgi:hypothetical protein